MEPPEGTGVVEVDHAPPEAPLDRLDYLEARVRELEERIPTTQLLNRRFLPRAFAVLGHYFVAGLIVYVAVLVSFFLFTLASPDIGAFSEGSEEATVSEGPLLSNVASLPVDASGSGTVHGAPTGEAAVEGDEGSFILVLNPTPAGLPARTRVRVEFDRSTKVYRDDQMLGDPIEAMTSQDGSYEADPSAAGTVIVRFRIVEGRVFADRLDLSDESP